MRDPAPVSRAQPCSTRVGTFARTAVPGRLSRSGPATHGTGCLGPVGLGSFVPNPITTDGNDFGNPNRLRSTRWSPSYRAANNHIRLAWRIRHRSGRRAIGRVASLTRAREPGFGESEETASPGRRAQRHKPKAQIKARLMRLSCPWSIIEVERLFMLIHDQAHLRVTRVLEPTRSRIARLGLIAASQWCRRRARRHGRA